MGVLAVTTAFLAVLGLAYGDIRGVRPEVEEQYYILRSTGTFKCFNSSKTIAFDRVNDDFCDCEDGSDEPGTSACSNGQFYCANRGHEARTLHSSFVDDGICDCCDGTDESSGCANMCAERNLEAQARLRRAIEDVKAAMEIRKGYAAKANDTRKEMEDRVAKIDADVAAAADEEKKMEEEKQQLEATAEERKAARREKRLADEAAKAAADAEAAAAAAAAADAAANGTAEAAGAGGAAAAGAAAAGSEGAATPAEQEETAEERGRRIAAQWTHDPEAAGAAPAEDDGEEEQQEEEQEPEEEPEEEPEPDHEPEEEEEEHPEEEESAEEESAEGGAPKKDPDTRDPELEELDSRRRALQNKVARLKTEKEGLLKKVSYDYAPDGAWLALKDHCAEVKEPQFTYRLCLFDKAQQVDNNGGHRTNLGAWKRFENRYMEGVFEGGDACAGKPGRSMRVTFLCGLNESAFGASEPATCAYAATMVTPAACKKRDLKALEEQLAAVEEMAKEAPAGGAAGGGGGGDGVGGGSGGAARPHDEL